MSRWISITADDLDDTKLAALVEALRTAALGEGQADPSPAIIEGVVARVRTEVSAHRTNRVDADTTRVPQSLHRLTCRLILAELKNRLEMPLTEDERRQQDKDERYLIRVARGEVPVESPDTPIEAPVETAAGVTLASKTTRRMGRKQLEGL